MKDFKVILQSRTEANQERVANSPVFVEIFKQSFIIARAFGMADAREEHILLALIKYAPQSLAVKYMETLQSKEIWRSKLHSLLINNVPESSQKGVFFKNTRMYHLMKSLPREQELLQCKTIDENCVLLAILRYQDFDGMAYKDAIQFVKKHTQE
jgi:hypothetical protein